MRRACRRVLGRAHMSTTAPAERLLSIEVGRRFPLDGVDVRAIAAADGPEGLVALSGRQGLWLAAPEDASGERCLTRAISKDAAGKWLDLGSVSWCVSAPRRRHAARAAAGPVCAQPRGARRALRTAARAVPADARLMAGWPCWTFRLALRFC